MSFCKINGKAYDVNVISIEESFSKLYTKNTQRTIAAAGTLFLDPIGTFIGHTVKFAPLNNPDDFLELWDFFKLPHREGFPVEIADGKTTISYKAHTSTGSRKLNYVRNGVPYWDSLSVQLAPIDAQILP